MRCWTLAQHCAAVTTLHSTFGRFVCGPKVRRRGVWYAVDPGASAPFALGPIRAGKRREAQYLVARPTHGGHRVFKLVNLLFRGFASAPVLFLEDAKQLIALAIDAVEVIVSELAPFLLQLALGLTPASLDLVPGHDAPPVNSPFALCRRDSGHHTGVL